MPEYPLLCEQCGEVDTFVYINEYFSGWPCKRCGKPTRKDFSRFRVYHLEDRYHHGGEHYNRSLGQLSPRSRSELKRLESQGVTFESVADPISPETKAAKEYQKAIDQGATHEEAEAVAPWPGAKPRDFSAKVSEWADKRRKSGKPMDALTEAEVTPAMIQSGQVKRVS